MSKIFCHSWLRATHLCESARETSVVEPRGLLVHTEPAHAFAWMTDIPKRTQAENVLQQYSNTTLHLFPCDLQLHANYLLRYRISSSSAQTRHGLRCRSVSASPSQSICHSHHERTLDAMPARGSSTLWGRFYSAMFGKRSQRTAITDGPNQLLWCGSDSGHCLCFA